MTTRQKRTTLIIAGAVVCAAFFVAYAFLPLTAPLRFNSPDESANYFFTGIFRQFTQLWAFDELNLTAPGLIHPRSIRVVDDFLVPGSFLGLPVIFGSAAKVFSMAVVPFLTPLAGVLAALAWGALIAKCFNRRVGIWSAALLLVNPAWWYGSSRPLMPNVLFMSLTIGGAWFLLAAPIASALNRRKLTGLRLLRLSDGAIGGILLALALAVRMSEAYWMTLVAVVLLIANRKNLPWPRLLTAAGAGGIVLASFLVMQQAAYGSVFATGYGDLSQGVFVPVSGGWGNAMFGPLRPWLFPLGFVPRTALTHFMRYGIAFFWWWSAAVTVAVGAAGAVLFHRWRDSGLLSRKAVIFALSAIVATSWLVAFYGSWTISDNPDVTKVTIGSSYLRYWLPIFVFSTVPLAWLVSEGLGRLEGKRRWAAAIVIFCAAVAASAVTVFGSEQEGLLALRQTLIRDDAQVRTILAKTPPGSLIVVDRADKLLFPARSVMYPLRSESTYVALPKLAKKTKVFYFGITFPEQDLEYLRREKLAKLGLTIDPVVSFELESLYSITPAASQ